MLTQQVENDFQEIDSGNTNHLVFVTFNHTYARMNLVLLNQLTTAVPNFTKFMDLSLPIPGITISHAP